MDVFCVNAAHGPWLLDIDTHVFLWTVNDNPRLCPAARSLILDTDDVQVSVASLWEIAIKTGLGKLEADVEKLVQSVRLSGFRKLPKTRERTKRQSKN